MSDGDGQAPATSTVSRESLAVMAAGASSRGLGRVLGLAGRVALFVAGLVVVGAVALGARLAQAPMEVTSVARLVARHVAGRPSIGAATLFWDVHAAGSPFVLDLRDAVLRRADGSVAASAGQARVRVLPAPLLILRARLIAVDVAGAEVALLRAADGSVRLDRAAARGSGAGDKTLSVLRRVGLREVRAVVSDQASGARWVAQVARLDVDHIDSAEFSGSGAGRLEMGGERSDVTVSLAVAQGGRVVRAGWSGVDPARLGVAAAVDLPVSGAVTARLGADWRARDAAVALRFGAGRVQAGRGFVPVASGRAEVSADFKGKTGRIGQASVTLGEGGPVVRVAGTFWWGGGISGSGVIDLGRMPIRDIGRYWPAGLAASGRAWVTQNLTGGEVTGAHLTVAGGVRGGALVLDQAGGELRARDVTLAWLAPVPPITQGEATLSVISPDAITVRFDSAAQAPSDARSAPLTLSDASLAITGLTQAVQLGVVEADIAGPAAQMVALLREERLRLLSRHPVDFGVPSGRIAAHVHVRVPLETAVAIGQIEIRTSGALSDLHLGGVVGGKDLDHGALSLRADNAGLVVGGTADLAGVPAEVSMAMDFRPGGADQVVTRYGAKGVATAGQLAAAGFGGAGVLVGSIGFDGTVEERRDGAGLALLHADLSAAEVHAGGVALKAGGVAGQASVADVAVRLDHDRIAGIERISVTGPGVDVQAAGHREGSGSVLDFQRIELGQTRAAGRVDFPGDLAAPVRVSVQGAVLDLSRPAASGPVRPVESRSDAVAAARVRAAAVRPAGGRGYVLDARFARVQMAAGRGLDGVVVHAQTDGVVVRRAEVRARAGGAVRLTIAMERGRRVLRGSAQDAGALLRGLDVSDAVRGGALELEGVFDDKAVDHPLSGKLAIGSFSIVGATGMAKALQAATVYGLVDVLRGPGLGFSKLVAPFRYADRVLTLTSGRAFSSSLGFTTQGAIDFAAGRADLSGTIVPGYFFNTLPGKLPLIGKMFSPEKGGGLFAATYRVTGALARPQIAVNPLAALTPGFLRGIFGGEEDGSAGIENR